VYGKIDRHGEVELHARMLIATAVQGRVVCARAEANAIAARSRRDKCLGDWRTRCNVAASMNIEGPYVVVLAGGDGNRLSSLTRALYGRDLPKQFAVLAGQRSLLQTTIERAMLLTSRDRISVVVTAHQAHVAREQLASYPGVELVVQPRNLDTAAGILLPLARLLARTASARIVFLPSDHYIADPAPMIEALRSTTQRALGWRVTMIGVKPTGPEVEYGWIQPGRQIAHTTGHEIARFQEKPDARVAEELWRRGGLWNTFIQTAPLHTFWQLAHQYLPIHAELLERYAVAVGTPEEDAMLQAAYDSMPAASFSRDVLAHAEDLAVIPVEGTGWSDWGSPQRVFASLAGTACHERLVQRIRGEYALAI
jgi:mannose-1-phosphate guanylyltransferase